MRYKIIKVRNGCWGVEWENGLHTYHSTWSGAERAVMERNHLLSMVQSDNAKITKTANTNMDNTNQVELPKFSFSVALDLMKDGKTVARAGWNNPTIKVKAQYPTDTSKMTKPYLYMQKSTPSGVEMFPLDLSCESIFAEDWFEVAE